LPPDIIGGRPRSEIVLRDHDYYNAVAFHVNKGMSGTDAQNVVSFLNENAVVGESEGID
jgi:hypothetical protein